jgi:hypothetical protein
MLCRVEWFHVWPSICGKCKFCIMYRPRMEQREHIVRVETWLVPSSAPWRCHFCCFGAAACLPACRARCSGCPILFHLAHRLQAFARHLERFPDHGLGNGEAGSGGAASAVDAFALPAVYSTAAVLFGIAVGGLAAVGIGRQGRVLPDVFNDAAQQGGEGGDVAGAEKRKRVILDCAGPVGRVGVQRMEEVVLDSDGRLVSISFRMVVCLGDARKVGKLTL